jgi:hypothetical protein
VIIRVYNEILHFSLKDFREKSKMYELKTMELLPSTFFGEDI